MWKQPHRFVTRKTDGQRRTLSLPHPFTQFAVVAFYKRFAGALIFNSSRSPYSLRHPDGLAKFSFSDDTLHASRRSHRRKGVETTVREFETITSFFRYRTYSNINSFYESAQFHRLEARFPFQRRLDITRCFESLYTHSIDWAIRGHHASKRGISDDLFSNQLDKLFQSANNGQTNGVIVGPEFSRIFAEIILQSADLAIHQTLLDRNLEHGRDYWIGRYVDDYFVFCGTENDATLIQEAIEIHLEKYNLRLNKAKQLDHKGPSHSPIHGGKRRIADQVSQHFDKVFACLDPEGSEKNAPNINKLISAYKSVLHDLNVTPSEVNNFSLGIIEKKVRHIGRDSAQLDRGSAELLARVLKDVCILVEFLYFAAPSVSSAIRANRILLDVVNIVSRRKLSKDLRLSVLGSIDRTCLAVIERHNLEDRVLAGPERYYWLLLHAQLGRSFLLSESELRRFIDMSSAHGSEYLLIVTVLLYMEKRTRYASLRKDVADRIEGAVRNAHPQSAERAMMQADAIACPYLEEDQKLIWMTAWFPTASAADLGAAIRVWPSSIFAAWNGFSLEKALKAKKRREVY